MPKANMPDRVVRKVVFSGPRTIDVVSEPSRRLTPREVRIATVVSGISRGTEMNFYRGDAAFLEKSYDADLCLFRQDSGAVMSYPIEFGYENVGRIVEVGADISEFSIDQFVVTYQSHRSEVILDIDSRDALIGDRAPVLPLPQGVPSERGVFVPLLGVAFNAMLDAQVLLAETVVIFGCGVVGLMALQLAKQAGAAAVLVVEPVPKRQDLARKLGADAVFDPTTEIDVALAIRERTDGRGADIAIEASGNHKGLAQAIRVVGYNGRVVAASWLPGAGGDLRLGEEFHLNRVRLISSQSAGVNPLLADRWDKARRTKSLLELLPQVNLDDLITHRFPLEQAAEAYRMVDNNPEEVLQVVLTYD